MHRRRRPFSLPPALNARPRLPTFAVAVAQIVKPLWEPFVVLFPELSPLLENLNRNCDYYMGEGQRLEQERLAAAAGGDKEGSVDVEMKTARADSGGAARPVR